MAIISRGFAGRRSTADAKLPPGQYLTEAMGLEVFPRVAHRKYHG